MLFSSTIFAQEVWDWQKCIDYALKNNIQIQQTAINVENGEVVLKGNKANYSPNINASSNYNLRIGNNYNFFNNSYEKQLVHNQDYGLSVTQPIFDGLITPNTVKKSKIDLEALKLDQDVVKNNIQLQILTAFLNIMNANEQHQQAINQFAITQQQYERLKSMINAGAAAELALLDIDAQLANESLTISQIKNQLDLAYLNLKQLLQLEPNAQFTVKIPELSDDFSIEALENSETIYNAALQQRPEIKSVRLKTESANKQIAISKGNYYPTLNFVGNISTFFTTQSKNSTQVLTGNSTAVGFVEGTLQRVMIPETITQQSKNPYGNQFKQNLGYALGLSLNIPIFNQYKVQTAVKQSKLQYQYAQLTEKQASYDLYNTIQQAYLKAQASIENFNAAKKSYETAKKSYDFSIERLNLGSINQLEVNLAKTNLDNALSKYTQAKYEYLFNTKLLDFYQGKKIEL